MCEDDNCHCDEDGILLSSIKHTLKISLFVLIANILIDIIIYLMGEDKLSNLLINNNIITSYKTGNLSSNIFLKFYKLNL